ncbi:SDR family oxidoreductase, partial [Streptomyces sp. NPDC002784]
YAGDLAAPVMHYIDTKVAGEEAVRDGGAETALLRPSLVIGDSVTGRISAVQGLCAGLLHTLTGQAPFVPLSKGTLLDVVSSDHVAQAVLAATERTTPPGDYWITSAEAAATCGRAVELMPDIWAEHGITRWPVPECVEPREALRRIERLRRTERSATVCLRLMMMLSHAIAIHNATALPAPDVPTPSWPAAPSAATTEAWLRTTLAALARSRAKNLAAVQ